MGAVLVALLVTVRDAVRHRTALEAELLALRHPLLVSNDSMGGAGCNCAPPTVCSEWLWPAWGPTGVTP
jgi:hypothetical protein